MTASNIGRAPSGAALVLLLAGAACSGRSTGEPDAAAPPSAPPAPALRVDHGVDPVKKVLRVGVLADTRGPAAAAGRGHALGIRLLAHRVRTEDGRLLPPGWRLELRERDHGYDPLAAIQSLQEIQDDVLFVAAATGAATTAPLRPMLSRAGLVLFPVHPVSLLARHRFTPPLLPTARDAAERAADWAATQAAVKKAAVVFQGDEFGADALAGWERGLRRFGVELVVRRSVLPVPSAVAGVAEALKKAEATHVLLAVPPSSTLRLLAEAENLGYAPAWVLLDPSWSGELAADLPAAARSALYRVSGLPYWGEPVPGMDLLVRAWQAYAPGSTPDVHVLAAYARGLLQLEAARRALESGDATRAGYLKALQALGPREDGLLPAVDPSRFPYAPPHRTRVLQWVAAEKTWRVVADYAAPGEQMK